MPGRFTTASSSAPGANGYKPAVVHYLDSSGQEVNTATPVGPDAPAAGYIDTAEYDRFGNVIRSLDATNRLLALGQMPTAAADLAALNLTSADTATRAIALSSLNSYSPDGLDLLRSRGPLLRLAIGNNANDVRLAHDLTVSVYDEGKPDGAAYHLSTTSTEGVVLPAADWRGAPVSDMRSAAQLLDVEVTTNGYNPIDGAPPLGATSGWIIGSPTVVTGDAGTGGANLISQVRYDAQGKAVESRKVGSNGSDAGTTRSVFYTAGANPDQANCGNNPHYAGLPCATLTAGAVTGGNTARMADALPTRTVTAYNRYGSIQAVTESATGPVPGQTGTITQSRTTTTTYDDADRITSVAITTSGAGVTPSALPKVVSTYDQASGDVIRVATVDASGTVISKTEKVFDLLGRMTSYTDAAGGTTTSQFDRYGKPTLVTNPTGNSTFNYDRAVEPRGYVTSTTDSVAGTIAATYGPDGQLLTQTMPGGLTLTIGYDAGRNAISRVYTRDSDKKVLSSSAIVENGSGQWISHATSAASRTYAYDRLGRLTQATDTITGLAKCNTRTYAYGNRSERLSRTTITGTSTTCPTPASPGNGALVTTDYTYDSGDRLVSDTTTGAAGWVYDPLGRIINAPVATNPSARVANTYWANDMIATQVIDGVAKQTWNLDPLQRLNDTISYNWTNNAWAGTGTKVNHYDSDSDSPAWISVNGSSDVTRFVDGLDGNMTVQTGASGGRVLQLLDLQGSVMTTISIADGATAATWSSLRHIAADEFGRPMNLSTGASVASTGGTPDKASRYGWLGGAQRSTHALAGVVLMGARLYDPNSGRFWSVDSVPAGNSTAYDYCTQDPINCVDLDGLSFMSWVKDKANKATKIVAKVGEYASNIPGPIGAMAAGVSAVAYAATGNKKAALMMVGTIALSMVGATAALTAVKVGGLAIRAGRAATKAVKAYRELAPVGKARTFLQNARGVGAKSRLFGDIHSGAKKPGILNPPGKDARWSLGWSGKGVKYNKDFKQGARIVFRAKVANKKIDIFHGSWRGGK